MSQYSFRKITTIHNADEFNNIMLSRTQRKTPTVVRRHYVISRIRKFYMMKIQFIMKNYIERFRMILDEFPNIDDLHPFYAELLNTVFNKEHYKIALGQINTMVHLITKVGTDYCRLLKYAASLFQCKKLKKSALGRMVTIVKKQDQSFIFLEEVRQHMSRLPTIDPNERTLLLCGCPNAGKSSFMNLLTHANVEVQPYAFTTKSLYVGHMDYDYLRWQVIDTPGILDRPFDEMNTIELQAVTALTHIKSAVLFFVDLSEECDITIENQLKVFDCLNPLFTERPMFLACNKSDKMTLADLEEKHPEKRAAIKRLEDKGVKAFEMSTWSKEGVMDLRNFACDQLLSQRVDTKLHSKKTEGIMNRVYVAVPRKDGQHRPTCIPESVRKMRAQKIFFSKLKDKNPDFKLETEIEADEGDDYVLDYDKDKDLENDEWKTDKVPRFWNGKNIADFIDPNFNKKLETLLAEEEDREAAGFYDDTGKVYTQQEEDFVKLAQKIRDKIKVDNENRRLDSGTGVQTVSRASRARVRERTTSSLRQKFENLGVDMSDTADAGFATTEKRARSQSRDASAAPAKRARLSESRARSSSRAPRGEAGEVSEERRAKLKVLMKKAMKKKQIKGSKHESDRHIYNLKPKHLFSGKRGIGTNQRR